MNMITIYKTEKVSQKKMNVWLKTTQIVVTLRSKVSSKNLVGGWRETIQVKSELGGF